MPRRTTKPFKLEVELERMPLKPGAQRRLERLALRSAGDHIQKWRDAQTKEERFYAAPNAAVAAFNLGEHELAKDAATHAVESAESFPGNWNHGNALHFGHTALGLLALHEGNTSTAAAHLHMSGQTEGSPQLGSFGPTMQLARALLKVGAAEPVLAYFQQCRTFWHMGHEWLDVWQRKVRSGVVPNFPMHSYG